MLKSSELFNLISIFKDVDRLKIIISKPLVEFRKGRETIGGTAPIEISSEGHKFFITKKELLNLCHWYLTNKIDEFEIEYLTNAIELCDDFEYEEFIANELYLLSSPEINGKINTELVKSISDRLQNTD